jgi:hypothetical protein
MSFFIGGELFCLLGGDFFHWRLFFCFEGGGACLFCFATDFCTEVLGMIQLDALISTTTAATTTTTTTTTTTARLENRVMKL